MAAFLPLGGGAARKHLSTFEWPEDLGEEEEEMHGWSIPLRL